MSYIHHFNTRANKLLTEAKAIWGNQKLNKFPFLKAFEEQQFGQENMKHEPSTHFQYILYTKCTEKKQLIYKLTITFYVLRCIALRIHMLFVCLLA